MSIGDFPNWPECGHSIMGQCDANMLGERQARASTAAAPESPVAWMLTYMGELTQAHRLQAVMQAELDRLNAIFPADKGNRAIVPLYAAPAPAPVGGSAGVPAGEADMLKICAALGFDPTNHHNAAKCPYCSPARYSAPLAGADGGGAK